MSEIVQGLNGILGGYDALFCDVWGVVHNGERAHADAVEALMQARLQGVRVVLVTNSPKTPAMVAKQLAGLGVPDTAYDDIMTAGRAMQYSLFGTGYKKAYFLGAPGDLCLLSDPPEGVDVNMEVVEDYKAAEVVICAGLDYGRKDRLEDYEIELKQLLSRKLPMFCANPDRVVDRGDVRILCAGALADFYQEGGGVVYQFGKPFPPIYQLARERMQNETGREVAASRILFVGDGVETDLKGAMLEDMDALFVTGGLAAGELNLAGDEPDAGALAAYLQKHGHDPKYSIGKLRW